MPRVEQRRHMGADALAVVGQHGPQRVGVVATHRAQKAGVGGQHAGPVAQLVGVLRQHALQHALGHLQILAHRRAGVAVDARADGEEAARLHRQQQPQEQDDYAHAEGVAHPGVEHAAHPAPGREADATHGRQRGGRCAHRPPRGVRRRRAAAMRCAHAGDHAPPPSTNSGIDRAKEGAGMKVRANAGRGPGDGPLAAIGAAPGGLTRARPKTPRCRRGP